MGHDYLVLCILVVLIFIVFIALYVLANVENTLIQASCVLIHVLLVIIALLVHLRINDSLLFSFDNFIELLQ